MAQRFKFNILTGETAPEKYAAISPKDPYTFYLLETGTGYLGEKKLFDQTSQVDTLDAINPDNPGTGIPTETAIVNYVIEAVRDKVPYEIDGVPSGGTSDTPSPWDVYSIEETRVGTWVDGKPLYRRTFVSTTPTELNVVQSITEPINDVDIVVELSAVVNALANFITLPHFTLETITETDTNTLAGCNLLWNKETRCIRTSSTHLNRAGKPIYVTMKYTKTTD